MGALKRTFEDRQARIGHAKLLLTAGTGHLASNLARTNEVVSTRGQIDSSPRAQLVINARVEMSPQELEQIVRQCLTEASGTEVQASIATLRSLSPGRPQPTYRLSVVV